MAHQGFALLKEAPSQGSTLGPHYYRHQLLSHAALVPTWHGDHVQYDCTRATQQRQTNAEELIDVIDVIVI
jgi:hypothetical protein